MDAAQSVTVGGRTVERYGLSGNAVLCDGQVQAPGWLFGDVSKSQARKIRKAFRGAGWYAEAAADRRPLLNGWIRYYFGPIAAEIGFQRTDAGGG